MKKLLALLAFISPVVWGQGVVLPFNGPPAAKSPFFFPTAYGACVWDSLHDVGSCINAAIAAAAAGGGGTVMLPCGTYGLTTEVVNSTSGVGIRGCGVGMVNDVIDPGFHSITRLVWIGVATSDPAVLDYTVAGGATVVTHDADLSGFAVDCNDLCGVGIKVAGVTFSYFNIGAINPTSAGIWFTVPADLEALGDQHNDISAYGRCDSTTYSPTCLLFDQTVFPSLNVSYNAMHELMVFYNKGDGIVFGSSDNNLVDHIYMRRTANATGKPVVCANTAYTMPNGNTLVGYCRNLRILHMSGGLDVLGFQTGSTFTATGGNGGSAALTPITLATTADFTLSSSRLTFASTAALTGGLAVSCGGPVNGVFDNSPVQAITSSTVVTIYGQIIKPQTAPVNCTFTYGFLDAAVAGAYTLTATSPTLYTLTAPAGGHTQSGISASGGFLTFLDMVIPWTGTPNTNDSWTIVAPTPANKVEVDWNDRENNLPIPTFEVGTSGSWRSSGQLYPYGWNTPCIVGNAQVTGPNGGGASPLGQTASGAGSCVLGGQANVASGAISATVGGAGNTASGFGATVSGQNNVASGTDSVVSGQNATDRARYITNCMGGNSFAATGDNQTCTQVLQGTGATGSALRLTANGLAAGTTNCINIPNNTAYTLTITISAFDITTVTKSASWNLLTGLLVRGANAAATALNIASATPAVTYSNGTLAGNAMSITADTTNGCLNISWTPPTGNTDTWQVNASVSTLEN